MSSAQLLGIEPLYLQCVCVCVFLCMGSKRVFKYYCPHKKIDLRDNTMQSSYLSHFETEELLGQLCGFTHHVVYTGNFNPCRLFERTF